MVELNANQLGMAYDNPVFHNEADDLRNGPNAMGHGGTVPSSSRINNNDPNVPDENSIAMRTTNHYIDAPRH